MLNLTSSNTYTSSTLVNDKFFWHPPLMLQCKMILMIVSLTMILLRKLLILEKRTCSPSSFLSSIVPHSLMEPLLYTTILSWNIRGANNSKPKRQLKDMIRKYKPSFLAIYETLVPFLRLSTFWNNNGYNPQHIIEANGHSGGIWLLKQSAKNTTSLITDFNQYSITFTVSLGDATTTCTCVYASPNATMRTYLWTYLSKLNRTIAGPWMLIGDFNETIIPSDQRGGIFNHTREALFSNFMAECNLIDLAIVSGRFTWHRNHNGLCIISKKLDRGIANIN